MNTRTRHHDSPTLCRFRQDIFDNIFHKFLLLFPTSTEIPSSSTGTAYSPTNPATQPRKHFNFGTMPRRMRMIDEETLRDEIRENPKSTRWVSKRGVVRKKQGGGKGKGDAVDEGQARERHARDGYEREKHQGEVSEIDALARKMHARDRYEREKHRREMCEIDALARKMHARDMYEREKHRREMSEIDAHARKMHARAMHDRQVHTQELYESEKRERENLEREMLESEKLERDLRAREIHAREMHDGQTLGRDYDRQMNDRDMPERRRRNHPPLRPWSQF